MRFWICLLAVASAIVVASPTAGAVELVNANGSSAEPFQTWANGSKMPTPAGRVFVFTPTTPNGWDYCGDGKAACAYDGVVPSINFFSPVVLRPSVFFHELGHVYDYSMPSWKREEFFKITGYGPGWKDGPNSAAERFADAYSLCARGVKNVGKRWRGRVYLGRWGDNVRYSPRSPAVHHAVCRLIQRAS